MAVPIPDVRIDWRGDGFSFLDNDSFLVNTSGWSVAAGIQSAATSLTRTTGDGVLGNVALNACAELVTTATNGSGCKFVLPGTFTAGRTYRFSVWLKSVSGTTSAKILIGSLGTGADRATATATISGSWTEYIVDWTPSGSRSDVQVNVANNAASIMTARISLAEVYEAIDDITGANDVDTMRYSRGANFDGTAESPGTATLTVNNITGRYSPDNGSSDLSGLLATGRPVMIRASYQGVVYGLFAGTVRRIVPLPATRTAQLLCEDRLYDLSREPVSIAASVTTSIVSFRGAILDAVGWTSTQRDLATGSPEGHIPLTEADQRKALELLADLNTATGTIHYIKPHPSPSIGWIYTTFDRTEAQTAASAETISDTLITGLDAWDVTDEAVSNNQRVNVTTRTVDLTSTVWTADELPFTVPASTTRTIWATFDDPVFAQVLTYAATNAPTITLTPFSRSAKIDITTGGSSTTISDLHIDGQKASVYGRGFEQSTTGAADKTGAEITSDFIEKRATAKGLADYVVQRYGTEKPRPLLTRTNAFTSQLTREVADVVTLDFALLSVSGKRLQVRSLDTFVDQNANSWVTTYGLETALDDTLLFTIGGSAGEGVGGTGVLAF